VGFAGNFYSGTSPSNVPWTNGVVPYEFTNTLSAAQQETYLDGLREWELAANVKFVPHTNQTRWILFSYNTNFLDFVSSGSYSPQMVTISSLSRAQVCHEMGHSFGFNHENIRPDQTSYIAVLTNNITDEPSNIHWFIPDPTTVTNGNYDYESVMHLGWDFDSTNPGVLATQQPQPPDFPRYRFRMGNYCLSPGDRAALAYLYGPPAVPLTNIVTTTADVGPGSLRAAIYYATDHPGSAVRFNIPNSDPGYSNGVYNLHLTGHLPPLVANGMVIDGSTQPGFTNQPLIVVDASQIIPETYTSDTVLIYSSSNQIKNISFTGFDWNGLTLIYADATNNTISGCWLGVDSTGTNSAPNAYQGILIAAGASRNIIGGTNVLARNVISGNLQYGILITDSNTVGNAVLGNYVGTDAHGTNIVSNGKSGVLLGGGTSGNIIGGSNVLARNILSGNREYGIYTTNTSGNAILGNYIGTDVSGSNAIPNWFSGLFLDNNSHGNVIGGLNGSARNLVSGNTNAGIWLTGPGTTGNVVQGNWAGLNASGNTALPNTFIGMYVLGGAQSNMVLNNVFSGNPSEGLRLADPGTSFNQVQGNYFGTDAGGSNAVPNNFGGVTIFNGATSNTIGGTTLAARNVISGNYIGVVIGNVGTSGNVVQGNLVGIGLNGQTAVANTFAGIVVSGGAVNNLIGGTIPGVANFVSANLQYGVSLTDVGTSGNTVEDNFIGTDVTGTNGLGNGTGSFYGANVELQLGASGNFIGGTAAGAGNVIAFSSVKGVLLFDPATTHNAIRGNSIFGNTNLGIDLNNDGVTPNHIGLEAGPNDFQNYPVITSAFGFGANTGIAGTLNSLPNQPYFVDVYRSPAADPSGYGQGKFYLGSVSVTTDGSGNGTFAFTTTAGNYTGQYLSTTATSAGGDTSEFSLTVLATNYSGPLAQFLGPFQSRTNGFAFSLALQTNFNYRIQAATNLAPSPVVWTDLTNFLATNSPFSFTDRTATNYRARFYRIVSP
jgi:parallel beta-helix repeat protein